MTSKDEHLSRLRTLGLDGVILDAFSKQWDPLQQDGYEMYAIYTGASGSILEDKVACTICSKGTEELHWEKVVTPSQDSAAIYLVCGTCDAQYVEAAIRQKALGRLLKERNTRPT
jgi:hypothetical protein